MSSLSLSAILTIVDEATRPLKLIRQHSDHTENAIEDLTRTIEQLNRTLGGSDAQRYNQSLKQTEKTSHAVRSATRMMVTEYGHVDHALTALLHKTDQWNEKLKQSRASMHQEFKAMAMGGVVAGAGLYQFFQPAIEFEKQMSGVQAVLDLKKHSDAMKMLEADARKWGAASSFSPKEAAEAQFNLGSGGFNPSQIHEALGGTLQLAEAGKVELAEAAQIAIGTLNGFGLAAKDINRVNDIFLQSTNATATSVQGLGETMKYVAPVAKQYGASIEETTAMAGLLGNNNILDTQAGTSLRGIMLRLASPPKAAKAALQSLNVTTVDAKGNLRDMADILDDIRKSTAGMGSQKRLELISDISGVEAASAMAVLVDQTSVLDENTGKTVNKIKQLTSELENSEGAAARAAAILKDNLAGDIENMGGAWQDFSISIQKVLGNDLRKFIQQITEIIDRIKTWVDENPELVRTLAKIAMQLILFKVAMLGVKYTTNLFFGAIVGLIAGVTKLAIVMFIIRTIAGKLGIGLPSRFNLITKSILLLSRAFTFLASRAIPLVLAGIRTLSIALLTNPLTWIIALIGLVALAIYRYWQPIKAFFKGFWDGLKIGLAPVMDSLRSAFNNLKATLAPLQPVWDTLVSAWTIFKGVLGEILTPMQATNQELQNATSYGQVLGQFIGVLVGIFAEAFMTIGRWLGETAAKIVIFVGDAMVAWENFKNSVMTVGANILDHLLSPIQLVIGAVNMLISGLNKIPFVNIPKIPQIPQFSNTAATGIPVPTKTIQTQPIVPLRLPQAKTSVNHFAPAQIHISGVSDTHAVGALMEQKMNKWQQSVVAAQNRSYNDID
ncbi:phage tail tape measure protein [Acinetobacter sp. ANC 3832]|uniref:phage tail tape measure protein n=1 Tax=Acinetobacter sp. ANC 3832 TaxID=1977874 RepID=UPI000A334941|nr:phage tail tape measure protein [Acinetobacter sp. ANC 3832]OTG94227.1 phage tail tape measure protein [Acinetobacter sp. ANC 3832]